MNLQLTGKISLEFDFSSSLRTYIPVLSFKKRDNLKRQTTLLKINTKIQRYDRRPVIQLFNILRFLIYFSVIYVYPV